MGACCAALLELTPDEGAELVIRLLSTRDPDVRVQVALALGESHHPKALEPLHLAWQTESDQSVRAILLTCIGLLRSTESRDFLVSLICGEDVAAAADAIRALAPFRSMEGLFPQVERAVAQSGSTRLRGIFDSEFRTQVDRH